MSRLTYVMQKKEEEKKNNNDMAISLSVLTTLI